MISPDETEQAVLNAIGDDMENLQQIHAVIQRTRTVSLTEIAGSLYRLMTRGLVSPEIDEAGQLLTTPTLDPTLVWRAWFSLTEAGRLAWVPMAEPSPAPPKPVAPVSPRPPTIERQVSSPFQYPRETWRRTY